jgi:hypothetical protein
MYIQNGSAKFVYIQEKRERISGENIVFLLIKGD